MIRFLLAAGVVVLILAGAQRASGQVVLAGPYYPTPSWDQTFPTETRWGVLANFSQQAVLDRETGLVWEQNPNLATLRTWAEAIDACHGRVTGGRWGWRLPTVEELTSIMTRVGPVYAPPSPPFAPSPFGPMTLWASTTSPLDSTQAYEWTNSPSGGGGFSLSKHDKTMLHSAWCVRGGSGAAAPQ
jgi:hypothetical protein